MWQWGIQSRVPLAAINCSWSLLWRKDFSLIFTADTGKMVEKGNSYFLIVSPFLLMIQSITVDRSMQTLFCSSLLAPQSCCLQPAGQPSTLPRNAPNGTEGKGQCYSWTGPCKKWGKKAVKVRKGSLGYVDRARDSSMYPTCKPSSSVKRSKIVVCFGA